MKNNQNNNKTILTFLSQQYGLTIEDIIERNSNLKKEDIIISKSEQEDAEYLGVFRKLNKFG